MYLLVTCQICLFSLPPLENKARSRKESQLTTLDVDGYMEKIKFLTFLKKEKNYVTPS